MSLPHTSRINIFKTKAGGKFCTVFGWFCAVFFLMLAIVSLKDKSAGDLNADGAIVTGFIGCALGFGLIMYGIVTKRLLKRLESYMTVILNRSERSIENIANAVSRPPDFVLKDLRTMIRRKFFTDAFIDVYNSEIILRDMVYKKAYEGSQAEESIEFTAELVDRPEDSGESPGPETAVVTCKGCSATNKLTKGVISVCEFCGSPLSLE